MSLRFFKRIPIIPGLLYINISKGGISFSLRPKGASITAGRHGVTRSLSIPGTGISYRKFASYPHETPPPRSEANPDARQFLLDRIEEQVDGKKKS